jgi:hypothetical protein
VPRTAAQTVRDRAALWGVTQCVCEEIGDDAFGTAGAKNASFHATLKSAVSVNASAETITLPLHKGLTASGATTWYVVIDSSNKADAASRGVNYAPRLANALGTKAVQKATLQGGVLKFAGTVNFAPKRVVVPSKSGFPPTKVAAGAVGDKDYSPLVTTDGKTVLDAPQVANSTGQSDTVTNLDIAHNQVTLKLLRGWFNGTPVLYVRTDASAVLVAALEASTYAPNLNAAPGLGSGASTSARSAIVPVINGAQSGAGRQGLQSAVLSGKDPLNITQSFSGAASNAASCRPAPTLSSGSPCSTGRSITGSSTHGPRHSTSAFSPTSSAPSSLASLRPAAAQPPIELEVVRLS